MDRLASFAAFFGMALVVFVVGADALIVGFWITNSIVDSVGLYPLEVITWVGLRAAAAVWAVCILVLTVAAIASLFKPQLYRLDFLFADRSEA